MPGDGSSVHCTSDDGRDTDGLHDSLSDCILQLLCVVLVEELVDVDNEPGVDLVNELVVSGEDLDVRVRCECRVDLSHVLLNDCSSGHGVVDREEVLVDGLRCDLLSEPLFDGRVRRVESYEDGPPDVIPSLLDCRVVDAVEVVCLYVDVRVGQLVGHPGPLSERNSDVLVHHGDATLCGNLVGSLNELPLALGLSPAAEAVVLCVELCGLLFELLVNCVHEELLILL